MFRTEGEKEILCKLQVFHCKHDSASVQPVMFLTPGNALDCQELQVIDADWPADIWSHFTLTHLQPLAFFTVFYSR
jgi:hypothetical protein